MKNCTNCSEQIDDQAVVCPKCGAMQAAAPQSPAAPTAQPTQPSPQQPGVQPNTAYSQPNNAYSQPNNAYNQPNNTYTQPNNMYTQPNMPPNMYPPVQPVANDNGSFGWAVLGFFFPLVGLILFLVWKDSKPLSSKKAGIGALVSFILGVVLFILMFLLLGVAFSTSSYYYY